ncbi:hypothetical protein GJ743_18260 [Agromyces bracchium]|uniref:Uncharacterized protein n=1 Tax=Agromyces bracchium TaxID=88376 RepID=A0A6I3M6P4_9MICO|nr:hypothetical protein [Agromyces bracchium]MTH70310.1 hypothetical protein [Agromyces bracchium]
MLVPMLDERPQCDAQDEVDGRMGIARALRGALRPRREPQHRSTPDGVRELPRTRRLRDHDHVRPPCAAAFRLELIDDTSPTQARRSPCGRSISSARGQCK